MKKLPFMKFFPKDWLYDTRRLGDSEKAVWIDMVCYMWNSPERGVLNAPREDLARMVGKDVIEFNQILDRLIKSGVTETSQGDGKVTVMCRRMVKEENERGSHIMRQRRYRERQSCDGKVPPYITDDRLQMTDKEEKKRTTKRFFKPKAEEAWAYAKSIGFDKFKSDRFIDYYETKGWKVGSSPMKDWKAAIRTWFQRWKDDNPLSTPSMSDSEIRRKTKDRQVYLDRLAEKDFEKRTKPEERVDPKELGSVLKSVTEANPIEKEFIEDGG